MSIILISVALIWSIAVITPGPNFFITVQTAIGGSRRSALFVVLGISTGTIIWGLCGFLGIHLLFRTVPWIYICMKIVGGAYLIYLGLKLIRTKSGSRSEGGTNFNVVPEICTFTVERRFNPEEDLETEKARLFALFEQLQQRGIKLEIDVLQEGYSSGISEDHPIAAALAETVEALVGERPAFEMCPGILETRWYARKGIPAVAYGPGFLEVAHGPHEVIEIERIYQHTVLYALAAVRILNIEHQDNIERR